MSWANTLFPALPAKEPARKAKPQKSAWPDAARELSESLLRSAKLGQLAGGLEIHREAQSFEARWNELTSRQQRLDLYSPDNWLTRTEGDSSQTLVHWAGAKGAGAKERGVMGLAFGLGRIRKSAASDFGPGVLDRADAGVAGAQRSFNSLAPRNVSGIHS